MANKMENYFRISGLYRDNEKEHEDYHIIIGDILILLVFRSS